MIPQAIENQSALGGEQKEGKTEPSIRVERMSPDDPRFAEAQRLEYEVFLDENYTEEQAAKRLAEYAAYDHLSILNVAYSETGEMVGVLREIRNTTDDSWSETAHSMGYKTLDDFHLYPQWQTYFESHSPQTVVEAGTVGVPKEHRRSKAHISAHLYHVLYTNAMREGRHNLIASIDNGLLKIYFHLYNFQAVGPERKDYMGSDTTPVLSDLNELAKHLAAVNKDYYRMVIQGDFST